MAGYANVEDRTLLSAPWVEGRFVRPDNDFDDGFVQTAPVGSYRPNPFGLFDVIGNLAELCRDDFTFSYDLMAPRAGDGLRSGTRDRAFGGPG